MREHLHVDAGLVHLAQAQFADIVEPFDQPRRALHVHPGKVLFDLRVEVMLFQGDDVRFRRHCCVPLAAVPKAKP